MKRTILLYAFLVQFVLQAFSQASILEPQPTASGNIYINKNRKLEIGVILPFNIKEGVEEWLKRERNNYERGFQILVPDNIPNWLVPSSQIINPFDAHDIKVIATFKHLSSGAVTTREGFYYRNFEPTSVTGQYIDNEWETSCIAPNSFPCPNPNQPPSGTKNVWVEVPDPYDFRIRFSPDRQGAWEVTVSLEAWYNGSRMNFSYAPMLFTCAGTPPSANGYYSGGLLQLNPTGNFLQFEQTGQTFVPVGQNSWDASDLVDMFGGYCPSSNRESYLNRIYKQINHIRDAKGNFFRIGSNAYDFDIEWEKAGNFDTRMCIAWEIDSLVEYANKQGLYFIYDLISHHNFWWSYHCPNNSFATDFIGGRGPANHWNSNPYKGILGLNGVWDYFSNDPAKRLVKQKLRYIISRWGYSNNIAAWEILDEPEEILKGHLNPSGKSYTVFKQELSDWFVEMSSYIKNDLGDRHLITASFHLDVIQNQPFIDFSQLHSYYNREDANYKIRYNNIVDFHNNFPNINKPLYFGEMGTRPEQFEKKCDVQFHNDYWSTLMMGDLGPGLSWHFRYNDSNGSESTIRAIREFTNTEDLATNVYNRYADRSPGSQKKLEGYYLIRDDQKNGIGWIHNRSYYIQNYARSFGNPEQIPFYTDYTQVACTGGFHRSRNTEFYTFRPDQEYFNAFVSNWPSPLNPNRNTDDPASCFSNNVLVNTLLYPDHFDEVQPLPQLVFQIKNLLPNRIYEIKYYPTRHEGGAPYVSQHNVINCSDANGYLTITVPETNLKNPDWAFKLDLVGDNCDDISGEGGGDGDGFVNKTMLSVLSGTELSETSIYPNPSTGEIVVEIPPSIYSQLGLIDLVIVDVYGKKIREERLKCNREILDLSSLTKGVYFIKISQGNQHFSKAITIY